MWLVNTYCRIACGRPLQSPVADNCLTNFCLCYSSSSSGSSSSSSSSDSDSDSSDEEADTKEPPRLFTQMEPSPVPLAATEISNDVWDLNTYITEPSQRVDVKPPPSTILPLGGKSSATSSAMLNKSSEVNKVGFELVVLLQKVF